MGYVGGPVASAPAAKSGKATAAMVLGIIGLFACLGILIVPSVLAIVFGALALKEISRAHGQLGGRGKAIAGLVMGIVGVLAGIPLLIAVIISAKDEYDNQVFRRVEGDCVMTPKNSQSVLTRLEEVPCDEDHDGEVVGVVRLGDESAYPGEQELQKRANEACTTRLLDYIDEDLNPLDYRLLYVYPNRESWRREKRAVCVVSRVDGRTMDESIRD
jgi:hypothetical protein